MGIDFRIGVSKRKITKKEFIKSFTKSGLINLLDNGEEDIKKMWTKLKKNGGKVLCSDPYMLSLGELPIDSYTMCVLCNEYKKGEKKW